MLMLIIMLMRMLMLMLMRMLTHAHADANADADADADADAKHPYSYQHKHEHQYYQSGCVQPWLHWSDAGSGEDPKLSGVPASALRMFAALAASSSILPSIPTV